MLLVLLKKELLGAKVGKKCEMGFSIRFKCLRIGAHRPQKKGINGNWWSINGNWCKK